MRSLSRHDAALEPAAQPVGSRATRRLHAVPSGNDADTPRAGAAQSIFEQVVRHILLARRLGLDPLTVDERATAMLDTACEGWRYDRRCLGDDGSAINTPHPACLRAQYHHDVLLLEHGLLTSERTVHER